MSSLMCSVCSFEMKIPRKRGNMRKKGHIKHMWCPTCQETRAFEENYETQYRTLAEKMEEINDKKNDENEK